MDTVRIEDFRELGLAGSNPGGFGGEWIGGGRAQPVRSPVDGKPFAEVVNCTAADYDRIAAAARAAFDGWRSVPAPKRGEAVRRIGEELRRLREPLARLVTAEMGKTLAEARGEVQEMIDICDFAVGLSRTLGGPSFPSERRRHRMFEQWHPLGVVGVITAFNFPVAVWSWNAALALVCGDTLLWKPSSKAPLCGVACTRIAAGVLAGLGHDPAVCSLLVGRGSEVGDLVNTDPRIALVSYTGSVPGGRHVGGLVGHRFGRAILELGGNNAVIVSEKGNLDQALKAVYFGALGTAGQRCTSTRRVIVNESVYPAFRDRLVRAYGKTAIGDPRDPSVFMGPLVDAAAVDAMAAAIGRARDEGARILCGGERLPREGGCYVSPCLAEAAPGTPIVREETFAPLLYLMTYRTLDEAIRIQNDVPQGLSSAIFTDDLLESERFLSEAGSDCGIANVNGGTSGAEIGGAFGGEKETGGGRESGSDAWKAYMRRQTCTINHGGAVEFAQGVDPCL